MAERDDGRWTIVGTLFATLFLIWGPVNASGVFFLPVVKHFGWSRTLLSALTSTAPLAAGISSPVLGWLLDRMGSRRVMIAGALMVAGAYIALSQANTAAGYFLVFIVMGVGITASTIIPTALVITSWFRERRGAALGIAFAGIPLGGTVVTIWANYVVLHYGFRVGQFAMAVPILLIVVPLLAIMRRRWRRESSARCSSSMRLAVLRSVRWRIVWVDARRSRSSSRWEPSVSWRCWEPRIWWRSWRSCLHSGWWERRPRC